MHLDFGVVIAALELLGQSCDGLQGLQFSIGRVNRKGRYRVAHFSDHIGELAIGTQDEMPWAHSGVKLRKWRIVRSKRSLRGVEFIHEEFVEAEVVDHGEAIVR